MRNIFVVLVALFLMSSCDDGDVITIDLDFDQELSLCSNNTDSFIIYDLRNDPSESLSLVIPRSTSEVVPFFNPTPLDNPESITIDNASNRFLYRTYNRDLLDSGSNQELCSAVIPSDLIIQESYEATGGTAEITTTIVDDHNDGIPSEFEGRGEADANGNFPDAEDFDGDGVPNYLDQDDDDDNVPTLFEIDTENADGDDNPTTNFLDTDGDTIPDYLDEDDDGDDIPTINEDANGDKNPRNDTSINSNGILIADYLSDEVSINHESPGKVLINEYTRVTTSRIFIKDYNLEILSGDLIDFGTLINTITVQQEFEED